MSLNDRNKKLILSVLVFAAFAVIFLLSDALAIRASSVLLAFIYFLYLVFSPSSGSSNIKIELKAGSEQEDSDIPESSADDFKIIAKHSIEERETAEEPGLAVLPEKQAEIRKPDNFREDYDAIAKAELSGEMTQPEQLGFLIEKLLQVIRDAYMVHSALFFWYSKPKNRLSLEQYASGSTEIKNEKISIENDILSKIAINEEPEIFTDIQPNAEQDSIRYYKSPQGIRSFVGVPLFYKGKLTAILAMDSKEGDFFGIDTIFSMGRFVSVLSIIISLFAERSDQIQSSDRLSAVLSMLGGENSYVASKDRTASLERSARGLIGWDAFSFVYYNPQNKNFVTAGVVNKTPLKYVGENLLVDMDGSLAGQAIATGHSLKIDDTSQGDFIRYSKSEDVSFDGSFLAVPLMQGEMIYGLLCFESMEKNFYSRNDVNFISEASKLLAFELHSLTQQNMMRDMLSNDMETGALNARAFKDEFSKEILKAGIFRAPGSLVLLKIDESDIEARTKKETSDLRLVLADMVRNEITPLSLFGRLEENLFGIYLFNSNSKDAYLFAERFRGMIARKSIKMPSGDLSFSISAGIASLGGTTDPDELIINATLALNKAIEKGGNSVKSIN